MTPKELIIRTKSEPILRTKSRVPARPISSDVAPIRLSTRPLPVSAQVKRRNTTIIETPTQATNKPRIITCQATEVAVLRKGGEIIIKGKIPTAPPPNYVPSKVNGDITVLVQEHHIKYRNLFMDNLKPKHHNTIHYKTVLKKSGLLSHLSVARFE